MKASSPGRAERWTTSWASTNCRSGYHHCRPRSLSDFAFFLEFSRVYDRLLGQNRTEFDRILKKCPKKTRFCWSSLSKFRYPDSRWSKSDRLLAEVSPKKNPAETLVRACNAPYMGDPQRSFPIPTFYSRNEEDGLFPEHLHCLEAEQVCGRRLNLHILRLLAFEREDIFGRGLLKYADLRPLLAIYA